MGTASAARSYFSVLASSAVAWTRAAARCGQSARGTSGRLRRLDEERRLAVLHRRHARVALLAARADHRRPTSTTSRSPGGSRPTTSARVPSSSSKARRSPSTASSTRPAGTRRSVIALDGATGELMWVHRYPEGVRGTQRAAAAVGARPRLLDRRPRRRAHHLRDARLPHDRARREDRPAREDVRQGRRRRSRRSASSTATSKPIDLETGEIGLHSTPTVVRNTILVGSAMKEGMTVKTSNNTKGLARAFDARTGKLIWTFNTIPHADASPAAIRGRTTPGRSTATPACGRRSPWTRSSGLVYLPVESPTLRLLRRQASGQQPLWREPRVRRSRDRQEEVALPVRAPSDLGSRHVVGAAHRRRERRRPAAEGRRGAEQAGVALGVRPRHRRADLADRREAGAEGRRAR